ncbi:hypothetical protein MRB53_012279 [Persea americana]|uniref:Uncharacterized protein n=1 Tax=Persea americana TaxID=3435 RepID=A0ACC2LYJ8_PERAE|nr:hypothetical protein MRB53_012279 [Persea americana]
MLASAQDDSIRAREPVGRRKKKREFQRTHGFSQKSMLRISSLQALEKANPRASLFPTFSAPYPIGLEP